METAAVSTESVEAHADDFISGRKLHHCMLGQGSTGDGHWPRGDKGLRRGTDCDGLSARAAAPARVLDALRKRRDLVNAHRGLIARHEMVLGMTRKVVLASLAKPNDKSSVRLPDGGQERCGYEIYRYLPGYSFFLRRERGNGGKSRRTEERWQVARSSRFGETKSSRSLAAPRMGHSHRRRWRHLNSPAQEIEGRT
jgi:hypothetical protein